MIILSNGTKANKMKQKQTVLSAIIFNKPLCMKMECCKVTGDYLVIHWTCLVVVFNFSFSLGIAAFLNHL